MVARRTFATIALLVLMPLCSGCHHTTGQTSHVPEVMTIDGRAWTPVQMNVHPGEGKDYTLELLPQGQTKDNWQEIITIQFFRTAGKTITPRQFEESFMNRLEHGERTVDGKKEQFNRVVGHQVIDEDANGLLFNWHTVSDPDIHNQEGLVRVLPNPKGLNVVQYASAQPFSEDQLKRWQTILETSGLEKFGRQ